MDDGNGLRILIQQVVTSIDSLRASHDAMREELTRNLIRMEQIDNKTGSVSSMTSDHEARIRVLESHHTEDDRASITALEARMASLEKFRWMVMGAIVIVNILAAFVQAYISSGR